MGIPKQKNVKLSLSTTRFVIKRHEVAWHPQCPPLSNNLPRTLAQVTVPARELLEAREEIPAELMAQIIKFMLLQVKDSDQRRRKTEQVRNVDKMYSLV